MQTWQVTKIPAVKRSYASPTWNELTPCVYFAPSQFEFEGYKGNGSTWEELGKFQIELNKGRDVLPPGDVQKVKNIISGIDSEQEKVKLLYEYLQKNTRYISIQLGIGGLQPFEAGFVAQKGYGDCKALSNYMYSLLKAAGIRSYYTWVRAGEGPDDHYLIEDFPSDQFNHIILCVPLSKDTLWLECTNQDVPAGYMGRFTGNRKALLITEEGGKLVSTPRYALKENFQLRTVTATLSADGNLEMNVETKYGGIQQDQLTMMIHSLSREKVQRMLQEGFQLSTYHVNDFKYDAIKAVLPQLNEHLSISVSGYATVSGKRLFITPNVLNRSAHHMEAEEDRQFEFVFGEEWRDEDHYEIVLPDGYEPEALPRDVAIRTKFGSYTSQTSVAGNKIVYHRVREQYAGHFPAADQTLLAGFLNEIHKADRSRIVMVKKGG